MNESSESNAPKRSDPDQKPLDWPIVTGWIADYVVKLATPRGFGTGCVLSMSQSSDLVVVATAAHVIDNAHYWEEPIRIFHPSSNKTIVLRAAERAVFLEEAIDTAALVFSKKVLPLPTSMLPLAPDGHHLKVGNEIGWLGFPAIAASQLCFFSGRISSWMEPEASYLVDGVAINGVSGGPAFFVHPKSFAVMGVVSAYIPNRATGESLPGLCVVRDVRQFQKLSKGFDSLGAAKSEETIVSEPPPAPEPPPGTPTRS